ncbi:MAG: sigma 54-interacting transcriptional regulator [Halioglobus sp.]|nr:sigma 54-interacting transcriptional regulator [Halioglobus sp.]
MTGSDELSEACFSIDADSGEILDCNDAAARLLGGTPASLAGEPWNRVIVGDAISHNVLTHALQAGRRVMLPPLVLRPPGAQEIAVGGVLLPAGSASPRRVYRLLLWQWFEDSPLCGPAAFTPSDTLAVLGIDQLCYDAHWGAADAAQLMADIHDSLLEIVRSGDSVSQPMANSILITLRDVGIEGARDICRAVLSHLRRQHTLPGTVTAGARICVGLAHGGRGDSALATLVAANNALLQAQSVGGAEPIRAASEDDHKRITGTQLNRAGIFSEPCPPVSPKLPASGARDAAPTRPTLKKAAPPVAPIEKDIEGYVVDNMEGAVDQAIFLSQLDVPVAIIGPAGTGKMYVARVIHEQTGAAGDMLVAIDCREFRNRNAAHTRIARELSQGEGKTLVFKSPHLMHAEVQLKLARQISTRTLADVSPPRYLPQLKLIALFPEKLEVLIRRGQLAAPLASVFAGYPINVPPIKDRKQAVLRWAHKILGQEGISRDRDMKGFTPDAEQAMLLYDWPGNISEMRQVIHDAVEKTDKDWLTPVDLGLFTGINPDGVPYQPEPKPFLATATAEDREDATYVPSASEALNVALGEAVHSLLALDMTKPLGTWLEDELVLAALDRYRGDLRQTGEFLHTKPRNISRWLPKIAAREDERSGSALWQKPHRLLREWVRESPQLEVSPLTLLADQLMAHVNEQGGALGSAARARIMGVSTPTYLKRCRETGNN